MSSTNPAPSAETADPAAVAALPGTPPEAVSDVQAGAAPAVPGAPAASRPEVSTAATGARLAELFPALFGGAPKPLKLRIQVDIQERAPGEFSKQALSAFFRRHTGATSYLVAVSKGKHRFDLDGQPAGELSEEHRQLATEELTRRRANQQARRAQENAERNAERNAQQHAQRQQAQAERRQRFQLLRDFETTKLTTANFCALKGIAPEQLDGVLAQARKEAAEDAARPQRAQHRPEHGHGRRDDRGRPQGPRGPRGGGRDGGGSGQGASGRNERRGPPRG